MSKKFINLGESLLMVMHARFNSVPLNKCTDVVRPDKSDVNKDVNLVSRSTRKN